MQITIAPAVLMTVAATVAAVGQSIGPGAIQGKTRDEAGNPIPGATVSYRRVVKRTGPPGRSILAPGESFLQGLVTADSNGSYGVAALQAGDYVLCGAANSGAYLDPCKWQGGVRVTVGNGSTVSSSLTLKKGVFLNVSIDDPSNVVSKAAKGWLGSGNLVVGVRFGNGAYVGADYASVTPTGRTYQMAVPTSVPLALWIYANGISIADSTGKTITSSGVAIPFQAVAGQDQTFSFVASAIATLQPVQ